MLAKVAVYFDDNKRINYPEGLVVNGAVYAEEEKYPAKKGTRYLLGCKYASIRKDFWETDEKIIKKDIESIVISFGGNDSKNLTLRILKLLKEHKPKLIKKIIIGKGFEDIKKIEDMQDDFTELIYYPHAGEIKKVFSESSIAISSAGQTLYELARVGVPVISIVASLNQVNNAIGSEKIGFAVLAGQHDDSTLEQKILKKINILENRAERLKQSNAGKKAVDGKGAKRIVEAIVNNDEK